MSFLMQSPVEAMCAVELSEREYLLVFASLAVYVDTRGRRSRSQEIMWPSVPNFVSKSTVIYMYTYTHTYIYIHVYTFIFMYIHVVRLHSGMKTVLLSYAVEKLF